MALLAAANGPAGMSLALSVVTTPGTHTVAGTVTGETRTAMTVRAMPDTSKQESVDGVAITAGDTRVLVPAQAALTAVPVPGTRATLDSVVMTVAARESLRRSGVVVAHKLLLRGTA